MANLTDTLCPSPPLFRPRALRVVVGSLGDCYHALGLPLSRYHVVPGRFKDFISTPKPNGYRSLHTTIIGPERHRIEVQIRTNDMHEVAEYGEIGRAHV